MGLPHVTSVVRPNSVEEAFTLLTNANGTAQWLAGGIDVVRQPSSGRTTLIDLSAIPIREIAATEDGNTISIGAAATLSAIMESDLVSDASHGELIAMLAKVASPLLRNLATLGGSIGASHPWSDIHGLLLAMGAQVELYDGSYRTVDLADVPPQRSTQDVLITRVLIPVLRDHEAVSFEKFSRTEFDVAILNCACFLSIATGQVAATRIVAGGTPARASRIQSAEARLLGTKLDDLSIEHAANAAADEPGVRDDVRASAEYRRVLLRTGVRRCLLRARARIVSGDPSIEREL